MLNVRYRENTNTWPGFVDLFSNLVIILIFLLIMFVFLWTTTSVFNKKSGAKTEWQKLLTADVMPMFAFSIYIDEELPSYSIAYIEVGNLVAFIQSCAAKIKRDKHGDTFFSCAWSELDRLGYLKYINANF